jgi:hypothetical protein
MPRFQLQPNGFHNINVTITRLSVENNNYQAVSVEVRYDKTSITKVVGGGITKQLIFNQTEPPIVVVNHSQETLVVIY